MGRPEHTLDFDEDAFMQEAPALDLPTRLSNLSPKTSQTTTLLQNAGCPVEHLQIIEPRRRPLTTTTHPNPGPKKPAENPQFCAGSYQKASAAMADPCHPEAAAQGQEVREALGLPETGGRGGRPRTRCPSWGPQNQMAAT